MGGVGVVLLVLVAGAVICAKARSAAGAAAFTVIAAVVFVATPVGQGVPDAVATFISAFDQAATPALNRTPAEHASTGGGAG
ncbi:hypothetical protein C8E95_2288 [Pseudonocardia autotrophica]|uniref:Uncharacterized protein n=2 Tax=Pseudonocardia TaxID=1847 RepID=A0A1Y2MKK5_PSEAH|nr:hypothetical protein BG845_06381 [Pseudonocardia autotrophica]TDN73204.1 hypothetical protein C8E95_2288 [Pseudonocardia autotrophica]BBG03934.1 hypothetical protein Pdca_51430 [Pseudonocardia autotrophica]GEC28318.1 hypothetical protein PSA01_53470 [Pseudonocardia saturnea]